MQPPEGLDIFLDGLGWGNAVITPVAGDASFRRYFRAERRDGRRAIIMDAPPPHEDPRPFINLAKYLIQLGLRAPAIWGQDLERGILLLEDFGDMQMRMYLDENPQEERDIYRQAIGALIQLSDKPPAPVPPYDMDAYMREVRLLTEWYMPAMNLPFDEAEYEELWKSALVALAQEKRKVTVLRDYHSENIMLLDNARKGAGQGIIDFQDALVGHPAYDLVSILQDARRDVSPELEREMLEYYQDQTGAGADFEYHYALLGAQRNTKIIGIFTRLWKRDGKARYLDFLPRMWGLLERDLEHSGLTEIKYWFDHNIPSQIRHSRPEGAPPA
ncbi:aminoglycoside phosphotransferase family protein [Sphingorhabdus arenilitoris]|uniref:Aminoglycoside phosphotransferase family protein n=1 Tax=Sphingorhabdus arenilitoris TaxID=1490041 RepID=A0ABV8RF34_9SPHN